MFNSKYSKFLTVLLVVAIIAIVAVLGFLGYDLYRKYFIDTNAQEAIAQFEKQVEENNEENSGDLEQAGNTVLSSGEGGTTKLQGYTVVGTIEIPKIDVKYPVLENVTKKSIELAVAVLYGPGLNQVGNTVIVGHNYRNGTMFSNISKLSNGDAIYITDTTGTKIKYSIYNMYQTTADDFEYATRDTEGTREISLSTCVTNDSSHRTIIWARED